jgi:hypothetical protein
MNKEKLTKKQFFKKNHLDIIQYIGGAMMALGIFDIIAFDGAKGTIPALIIGAAMIVVTRFAGKRAYEDYLN